MFVITTISRILLVAIDSPIQYVMSVTLPWWQMVMNT